MCVRQVSDASDSMQICNHKIELRNPNQEGALDGKSEKVARTKSRPRNE